MSFSQNTWNYYTKCVCVCVCVCVFEAKAYRSSRITRKMMACIPLKMSARFIGEAETVFGWWSQDSKEACSVFARECNYNHLKMSHWKQLMVSNQYCSQQSEPGRAGQGQLAILTLTAAVQGLALGNSSLEIQSLILIL